MNSLTCGQGSLQLTFAPCVMSLSSHTAFIPTISYTYPFWPFPEILVHSIYLSSIYMYNTRFTLLTNFKMYNMLLLSCFSVTQLCLTLCSSMDCCTPGFFVRHYLSEFVQTHAHWVDGAIQPSHPLLPPFSPALNLSQHQGVFQWVSSSHQVTRVLQLQLQHQVLFCMADL